MRQYKLKYKHFLKIKLKRILNYWELLLTYLIMILMLQVIINQCYFILKASCWHKFSLLLSKLNRNLIQKLIEIISSISWLFRLLFCKFSSINKILSFYRLILILIILILFFWILWFLWFHLIRLQTSLLLWMLVQNCFLEKRNNYKLFLLYLIGSLEKLNHWELLIWLLIKWLMIN